MTERELQALLDARLDPAAAERLIERSPLRDGRAARRLVALARTAAALPEAVPSSGFVERTVARLASIAPPRRRRRWPLGPPRSWRPAAFLAALAQRLVPRAQSRRR